MPQPSTSPVRLTVDFTQTPVEEAMREIGRQAGLRMTYHPTDQVQRRVSFRLRDASFEEVYARLCEEGGLAPEGGAGGMVVSRPQPRQFILTNVQDRAAPETGILVQKAPLYQLRLLRSKRLSAADLAGNSPATASFTLEGNIVCDPALYLLWVEPKPGIAEAADEQGRSLILSEPPQAVPVRHEVPQGRDLSYPLAWQLAYHPSTKKIVRLRGHFTAWIATEVRKIILPLPLKEPRTEPVYEGKLEIRQHPTRNDILLVRHRRTPLDPAAPPPWLNEPVLTSCWIWATDGSGHDLSVFAPPKRSFSDGVEFEVFCNSGRDSATSLEWWLPMRIAKLDVPFDFSDLKVAD